MSRSLGGRLRGTIDDTIQTGQRVIVAFRPERPADAAGRPLDDGIAFMVVTINEPGPLALALTGSSLPAATFTYTFNAAGSAPW